MKTDSDNRSTTFFEKTIGESKDLNDQLQDLVDFVKDNSKATAVYVGKLLTLNKPIKDDDDDLAHIDKEAP